MKLSNEQYRQKKIDEHFEAVKKREELRPILQEKYARWSANCEDCGGKVVGCNNPRHF